MSEVATIQPQALAVQNAFAQAMQIAETYAKSQLIPAHFQGKPHDCYIICEMADRLGIHRLMALQSCYVVSGRPGLLSTLVIGLVNSSGLFKHQLRFDYSGDGDGRGVTVWSSDKATGDKLAIEFKYAEAVAEGYAGRNPKWKTMRDQMLAYRGAARFARLYCPEILMGMSTKEEVEDIGGALVVEGEVVPQVGGVAGQLLNAVTVQPETAPETVSEPATPQEPTDPEKPPQTARIDARSLSREDIKTWMATLTKEDQTKFREIAKSYGSEISQLDAARLAYADMTEVAK